MEEKAPALCARHLGAELLTRHPLTFHRAHCTGRAVTAQCHTPGGSGDDPRCRGVSGACPQGRGGARAVAPVGAGGGAAAAPGPASPVAAPLLAGNYPP